MAILQRLDRGLDDMAGGLEIWLADREADDGLALCLQRLGAGQDLERGLGAKAAHAARQLKHLSFLFAAKGPLGAVIPARILRVRGLTAGCPRRQEFADWRQRPCR